MPKMYTNLIKRETKRMTGNLRFWINYSHLQAKVNIEYVLFIKIFSGLRELWPL